MAQVDGHILLAAYRQKPMCTVVSTSGGIEHLVRHEVDEQKGLDSPRETLGRDGAEHAALNEMRPNNFGLIDSPYHAFGKVVLKPLVAVDVPEVDGSVVDYPIHGSVVNPQHCPHPPPRKQTSTNDSLDTSPAPTCTNPSRNMRNRHEPHLIARFVAVLHKSGYGTHGEEPGSDQRWRIAAPEPRNVRRA